ncbi:TetR/AcrR family transcriptional regulator [bacterium]|nr:TetR/AcrR family transcriptional regulator [bacterium]
MKKGELKKKLITELMANYILLNGLQNASLRNLAIASNTSDRMLLHYFLDKNELLEYVLNKISNDFISLLDNFKLKKMVLIDFFPYFKEIINNSEIQKYIKLWIELISLSSREILVFRKIGQKICESFLDWIKSHIIIENQDNDRLTPFLILAIMEGIVFIDALGYKHEITHILDRLSSIFKNNNHLI